MKIKETVTIQASLTGEEIDNALALRVKNILASMGMPPGPAAPPRLSDWAESAVVTHDSHTDTATVTITRNRITNV